MSDLKVMLWFNPHSKLQTQALFKVSTTYIQHDNQQLQKKQHFVFDSYSYARLVFFLFLSFYGYCKKQILSLLIHSYFLICFGNVNQSKAEILLFKHSENMRFAFKGLVQPDQQSTPQISSTIYNRANFPSIILTAIYIFFFKNYEQNFF